jgi:type I restriction enzyme, S subunit
MNKLLSTPGSRGGDGLFPQQAPLPHQWESARLGDVAAVVNGFGFPQHLQGRTDLPFPFIKVSDMNAKGAEEVVTTAANTVDASLLSQIGGRTYPAGTVIFPKVGGALLTNKKRVLGCEASFDNNVMGLVPKGVESDWLYLWMLTVDLRRLANTQALPSIRQSDVANLTLPVPVERERRRIATLLGEQLAAVAEARAAVQAQIKAAQALPAAHLRSAFNNSVAKDWPRQAVADVCQLLPSKSIALSGDTEVRAITSACLTETGFNPAGVKTARMWKADAQESVVQPGEILIARSNTPDLVGRVSIYTGGPQGVVASDLTIRLWPGAEILSEFLVGYLSFLYTSGYWRDRAGGASGTMKKITRSQIEAERIPVPPASVQESVAGRLKTELATALGIERLLEERLTALDHLPAALLREAFSGRL